MMYVKYEYTRAIIVRKIHEKRGKKSAKHYNQSGSGYISEPHTQLGLTRLADFAKPTLLHPK